MRVDKLHKIAKLNLCKDCFEKYKQIIEPSIKRFRGNTIEGWPATEANLTAIIWKEKNAYPDEVSVLWYVDFDEIETLPEGYDRELIIRIKKWPFSKKLKYLRKKGIIGKNLFQLFEEGRKTRNKIHNPHYEFTDNDIELFRTCENIAAQIQSVYCFKNLEPIKQRTMEDFEEYSKLFLKQRMANKKIED